MSKIKSLPPSQRPREKIMKSGAEALSYEELLAVILNTGTRKLDVHHIAKKLKKLLLDGKRPTRDSLMTLEIGRFKTAQMLALLEILHRTHAPTSITVTKPEQVFALAREIISDERESILCLYLNARGELIEKQVLAVGSLNRASLLPREIFSLIKDLPIAGIILAHNHPSGDLTPSQDDIVFTRRVRSAGEILGVSLLDHLVVGRSGWRRIEI